jgi:hypothetical protein
MQRTLARALGVATIGAAAYLALGATGARQRRPHRRTHCRPARRPTARPRVDASAGTVRD